MDESLGKNSLGSFVKTNLLPLLLGVGGLMFLGYGLISSGQKPEKKDILFEAAHDKSPEADAQISSGRKGTITVDIEGAVLKPGIYKLPADSRFHDALIVAGGLGKNADRAKVSKQINLAAKLIDGGKIYIPFQGEDGVSGSGQNVLGSESGSSPINLNSATEKELDSLPGVGAVTAQKIISGRPYFSVDELVQKKIVGQKIFETLREKITVN